MLESITLNPYFLGLVYFALGLIGSIVKDIIDDGAIQLPKIDSGKLCLGFIGSGLIGGVSAILADNSPLTAFTAGFAGSSILQNILQFKATPMPTTQESVEQIIISTCNKFKIDPVKALKVARCESGLKPSAIHINADGSKDVGLFQINLKWHPEVSEKLAMDPNFATEFYCNAVLNGNESWWNATRSCWQ